MNYKERKEKRIDVLSFWTGYIYDIYKARLDNNTPLPLPQEDTPFSPDLVQVVFRGQVKWVPTVMPRGSTL